MSYKDTMGNVRTKIKETDIQFAICEYLAYKKYFFWRANNFSVFDGKKYRAMPKYSKLGVPDIILIKDGIFHGLEVKRPGSKQSDNQEAFEEECAKAGGVYKVVKSVDDVVEMGL